MRSVYRILVSFLVIGFAALVYATPSSSAEGDAPSLDEQPPLVEDYGYPGAEKIFTDYKVRLISGDGHLLFVDCVTAPTGPVSVIQVRTSSPIGIGDKRVLCFQVTAATGRLSLQVPGVYEIRGDGREQGKGHKLRADLTTDAGQHSTVDVDSSGSTQVGAGIDPKNPPTTLLELTASS